MIHDDKIKYLRIALAMQRIGIDDETAERIILTYEKVLAIGGSFTLKDAVDIEMAVDEKYIKKRLENGAD